MAGYFLIVLVSILAAHTAYGFDCSLGTSDNVVEKFINTCPRPLIDSKEEEYCCWTASGKEVHCCNFTDFIFNSISLALPLIIICLVVSFIVSCICCLCCPFCCCYKRRSGGSLERLQLQQQQLQIQQQQVLLQQQQLELERQRQLLQCQAPPPSQFPPPYSMPDDKKSFS